MQGRCDEGMEIEKWPLCLCVASVARSVARTASSPRPAATTASARQGGGHGATTTVILMWHEHSLLLKGFLWVHEYFLKLWNFFFFFSCPLTFAYFLRDNFCFTEFVFVFLFLCDRPMKTHCLLLLLGAVFRRDRLPAALPARPVLQWEYAHMRLSLQYSMLPGLSRIYRLGLRSLVITELCKAARKSMNWRRKNLFIFLNRHFAITDSFNSSW